MEVKPGYKQTEVGVIPEDWYARPLGDIGGVRMCKRVFKHQTRKIGDVPFYKIGTFGDVPDAFISQELFDEFKTKYSFPRKGDVLISAAGTIGRTVVYDGAPAYFQDSNIVWIDSDPSKATNEYLRHYYHVTKWSVSHGGTVARLYNDNLKTKIYVATPPLLEQRAIATALSDVDALLGGLDRLIAKKRDLKQAAMQQLLTGQTRLPGFSGNWEMKQIGEFTDCTAGGTPSTLVASYWGGSIPWMNSGELNLKRVEEVEGRITDEGLRNSSTKMIPKKCVLIGLAGQGKTRGTVAMNFAELCTNQSIAAIFPSSAYISEYLYYNLDARYDELRELSTGDGGRGGLNLTIIKHITIPLPSLSEQTEISNVLGAIDAELLALKQRRNKTQALKQGMMQELLTGRTRLV